MLLIDIGKAIGKPYFSPAETEVREFQFAVYRQSVAEIIAVFIFTVIGVVVTEEIDRIAVFNLNQALRDRFRRLLIIDRTRACDSAVRRFGIEHHEQINTFAVEKRRNPSGSNRFAAGTGCVLMIERDYLSVDAEPALIVSGEKISVLVEGEGGVEAEVDI